MHKMTTVTMEDNTWRSVFCRITSYKKLNDGKNLHQNTFEIKSKGPVRDLRYLLPIKLRAQVQPSTVGY